jgi:hypothetical protein
MQLRTQSFALCHAGEGNITTDGNKNWYLDKNPVVMWSSFKRDIEYRRKKRGCTNFYCFCLREGKRTTDGNKNWYLDKNPVVMWSFFKSKI